MVHASNVLGRIDLRQRTGSVSKFQPKAIIPLRDLPYGMKKVIVDKPGGAGAYGRWEKYGNITVKDFSRGCGRA